MFESNSETTNIASLKQAVFENEQAWLKWKAAKCQPYECQSDETIKSKIQARR